MEHDKTIQKLIAWGTDQDDVRAMVLTSTRAVPGGKVDALSDYDVIVVAKTISPFVSERSWINEFGPVLVAYWDPVSADPMTGIETSGNVVQYESALKIDFSLWPEAMMRAISVMPVLPAELDAGYQVLLDKDGITSALQSPSYRGYMPVKPDEDTFLTLINDFFIGVPYVAKCLVRGDVLPAKWCLDYDMRYVYLLPMLEWRIGCERNWATRTGVNGKGLLEQLPAALRDELGATYTGLDVDSNQDALFRMIGLFRRIGHEVGTSLGYAYPDALDLRVTDHARRMLAGAYGGR